MAEDIGGYSKSSLAEKIEFEQLSDIVTRRFQVRESVLEDSVPTYYLRQPQETKQPFLRLLSDLAPRNLIALLRRGNDGRIFLKIVSKPRSEPSNVLVNWLLFFATIGTTFLTGYLLSGDLVNPLAGGLMFTAAIMTVLGMHEMGHKLMANKKGIDATLPYFIPGPPPIGSLLGIGTFGAVIVQKSLPSNKDALFDVGASGPILGFLLSVAVSVVGLMLSRMVPVTSTAEPGVPFTLLFLLYAIFVMRLPNNYGVALHPVAFAGWVGLVVTMMNLLPTAMLDGGHVARSLLGARTRVFLTVVSVVFLALEGFLPMAILVLFISTYKHPGPLDDVSSLSARRKLLTIGLVMIFVLCSFPVIPQF